MWQRGWRPGRVRGWRPGRVRTGRPGRVRARWRVLLPLLHPVLRGEVAHATADAVLPGREVLLARDDVLLHLVSPVERVRVSGDGGLGPDAATRSEDGGGGRDGHLGLGGGGERSDRQTPPW